MKPIVASVSVVLAAFVVGVTAIKVLSAYDYERTGLTVFMFAAAVLTLGGCATVWFAARFIVPDNDRN